MGKFVIKKTPKGVRFNLKAGNGEIILVSEVYASDSACNSGIASLKKCCMADIEDQTAAEPKALKNPKYEVYADKAGAFRFRLKAKNGEIIGASEGYTKKSSCLNGIASVQKNAPDAPTVKEEKK